ncbi:MAG TPA: DUF2179 domain-containing protein [Spirochaetota bacterium]|nr:DUF2179 domain-containing protein [Spirochaetota bacterium]HPJ35720.1 DUF2179 domain-containing protein [Spirochaetota bacterium]
MGGEIFTLFFIFLARVIDVSLGTVRIILVSRGYKNIAPFLGFFEILIWITAIGQVMKNLNGFTSYLAYAAGFAVGTFVGMKLESFISIGYQSLRIITTEKVTALPLTLREEGFGITTVFARGMRGEVMLVYTTVPRSKVKHVLEIVEELEPNSFITIEDVRSYSSGFISRAGFFDRLSRGISKRK